ncbi:transcription-repair coupling factor [Lentilactobacillus kosonis]|uniref:Transcription-repair-coupling factor n=1 Tax=Lentilactobacillus kosonis TaxID=2810561 RepID=A0A401FP92_9LACO|nr:transcription-repair coupling factor [Lentilactobacillus kosonis]
MRSFNVADQRSIENIKSSVIYPASDLIMTTEQRQSVVNQLQMKLKTTVSDLDDEAAQVLQSNLDVKITDLSNGLNDPYWLLFSQLLYPEQTSIIDYLAADGVVVFDEYSKITEANVQLLADEQDWLEDKISQHEILPDSNYTSDFKATFKNNQHGSVLLSLFKKGLTNLKFSQISQINTRPMQQFFSSMPMLKGEVDRWLKSQTTVIMMVEDEKRLDKVANTLADFDVNVSIATPTKLLAGKVQLIANGLDNGFELPQNKLAVITERELFQKVTKKHRKMTTFSNAERIKSYTDLKPGDFVVHVNHGIGRYEGMKTMEVDGKHQDYLTITYKDNAQLFIPVTQLNLIQKYVSSEDKHPRINKLGGSEWAKTKQKVASKIEDIADDLIELYAKRSAQKGFAFPKDDALQHDFENEFPYNETPDQMRSAQEIKRDMENARPMDRLLVGDVGYGKTEVALRAAFKAIEVGKQVAFLVPTTILAQQHYETMQDRFADYPIEVRVLSRFQTKAEIKATLADLQDGTVDVVVGTHRILSKDVGFKDLGLLIIDEEQRFGVKHKERIKELRSNVDVLTLTATPIPRTLNMSMMGIRDLSVIETPPANRYPIQTYVMEQNAGAIRDAIEREMARGGQVFYLHNRVGDIEKTVANLAELVPDARIAYIHGKMTENQLENVLYEFINGEYDVMVTTTIIETGVDIPNVNTLFVENADRMGLSQLYQLRGRIGRSSRVAYAYFMYQPNKSLTEVGEKRLEAIRDFTELGSGFKIAMRDLSIRGAGNLLGKQQHGFVDSVGYDLYTQMLSDAVAKKRGATVTQTTSALIELDVEAYLPSDYIDDSQQKIELYKRIRQLDGKAQLDEITDDLIDRFGDFPVAVDNLLKIAEIKMNADYALIEKFSVRIMI